MKIVQSTEEKLYPNEQGSMKKKMGENKTNETKVGSGKANAPGKLHRVQFRWFLQFKIHFTSVEHPCTRLVRVCVFVVCVHMDG